MPKLGSEHYRRYHQRLDLKCRLHGSPLISSCWVAFLPAGESLTDHMDINDSFGGVTTNVNFARAAASVIVHPARMEALIGAGSATVPSQMPAKHAARAREALVAHVYGGPLVAEPSSSWGFGYFTTSRLAHCHGEDVVKSPHGRWTIVLYSDRRPCKMNFERVEATHRTGGRSWLSLACGMPSGLAMARERRAVSWKGKRPKDVWWTQKRGNHRLVGTRMAHLGGHRREKRS